MPSPSRLLGFVIGSLILSGPLDLIHAADPQATARQIDGFVQARLNEAKIPASPQADDAEFLRRAYLDIIGQIPTLDETKAFLMSKDADKRAKLIDDLLARPEYGRHFANIWRELLVDRTDEMGQVRSLFSWEFIDWLSEGFNADRGWDAIVTDMLTAEGQAKKNPATVFILANRMDVFPRPESLVGSASKLFMGMQLRCAQCHDHPYVATWSQDDFWGMAAFFGQLRDINASQNGPSRDPIFAEHAMTDEKKAISYVKRLERQGLIPPMEGPQIGVPTIEDPTKAARIVAAKFFQADAPKLDAKGPYRPVFSAWLTAKENPYFARAAVNRWWAHFFTRGLINPIDDMGPDHRASHPELLDLLVDEFKTTEFNLKHLIRCICLSEAYQRTSRPTPANQEDMELYSHMALKQLNADQMYDSLCIAIGRKPTTGKNRDKVTEIFATKDADDNATELSHGIPQFLNQMNAGLATGNKYLSNRYTTGKSDEDAITSLYLGVLSREPTPAEHKTLLAYLNEDENKQNAYLDIIWVLMNSAEFMFNH